MKLMVILVTSLMTLAGCAVRTAPAPVPPPPVLPSHSNTVTLPSGHTYSCTSYAQAVCPQS
jgi:hypothetical protein